MKKLYPYLTYAGAIPFVICVACLSLGINELPLLGRVEEILSIYALVIVAFLAGSHWGQHLQIKGTWSRYLPIFSNIIAVALWLAFLVFPFKALLATFGASFAILLFIDRRLFQDELISRQYFQTRCIATAIVISTIIIAGIFK